MFSTKFSVFLLVVIAVICLSLSSEAAVYQQRNAYHPSYPGRCFDRITQRPMLPNKEYKPKGICAVMTCDINTMTINIETCPQVEVPGCDELPSDPNWAYPKCCPQFRCRDFKTGQTVVLSP